MQRIRKRSHLTFSNTTINAFGRLLRRNNVPNRHTERGYLYYVKEYFSKKAILLSRAGWLITAIQFQKKLSILPLSYLFI
ncbi:DUF3874 domain-containing protein [Parabacteroides timonensis]|uniref:DUF3874 domain-containing protein n=1 Tax=Parabacteroides timonensis TaxID=1871013 RepID=UPI00137A7E87